MTGHDKITPDGKKFYKEIEALKKLQARVGFQHGGGTSGGEGGGEGGASEAGATGGKDVADIVDVAMWNELGTASSPARPFMTQSVENNEPDIKAACAAQLKEISSGRGTAQTALEALGVMQKAHIQNEIVKGSFVPNAEATIKRKNSDKPLIDSSRMRGSVNYTIEPKGGD